MARDNSISRRTAMKLTGAAAATALVAGCGGDDGDGNGEDNGGDEGINIDPEDEIVFEGQQNGWVGVEPSDIEEEENPTLILQEGEEYDISWEQGDDQEHNIELRDSDDEVVDEEYSTEITDEPDGDGFTFEATDDIADYVCDPHDGTMRGSIEIE